MKNKKQQQQELDVLIKKIYDYKKPADDDKKSDSENTEQFITEEQKLNPIRFLPFLKSNYFFRAKTNNSSEFTFYEIDDKKLLPNTLELESYKIVTKEKNPIRYSILNIYNL